MLLHKLALRLGRTVSELRAVLTADDLAYWIAYARTYPIGSEELADIVNARLCSVVMNANGCKKHGGGQFTAKDFLLFQVKNFTNPLSFLRGMFGGRVQKGKRKRPKE